MACCPFAYSPSDVRIFNISHLCMHQNTLYKVFIGVGVILYVNQSYQTSYVGFKYHHVIFNIVPFVSSLAVKTD